MTAANPTLPDQAPVAGRDPKDESILSPSARPHRRWKVRLRSLARDFLLIVAGVLTALWVENWNAANKDARLETEYLRALAADTRSHVVDYEFQAERLDEHSAMTAKIWAWAGGETPQEPVEEVLLWLRLGGQLNLTSQFQDGAYEDLVNSGKLGLIKHRAVREALIDYQNSLVRWNAISQTNGQIATDRYANAVIGVIPADIAWRAAAGEDLSTVDLAPILEEFRSRPQIHHALVSLAESHRFRSNAARGGRERAAELLSVLEAELGDR